MVTKPIGRDGQSCALPPHSLAFLPCPVSGCAKSSWRRRHKYLPLVSDHRKRKIVWGAEGRDTSTLDSFFDELGTERSEQITAVSMDMSAAYAKSVKKPGHAVKAVICYDPFHVVTLGTKALDVVRRQERQQMRKADEKAAKRFKGARWCLLKNPTDLDEDQAATLRRLKCHGRALWRAYSLKEALRAIFAGDLAGWMLNRVVWVCDSSFNSGENRAYLQRGRVHYIVAERVRGGSKEAKDALARAGRYHKVAGNLELKEVRLGSGPRSQRFCVCHNPEVAARDRRVRENLVSYLEKRIEGSDNWSKQRRDELVGELRTTPGLYRLLRRTPDGLLRVDKGAIANEERFDGKFLLRTSGDTLSTTDIALAYKQLYEVERGWRDLKATTATRLRPIYHYREDRIRSHVQICWLALPLVRTIEQATGDTRRNVRNELDACTLSLSRRSKVVSLSVRRLPLAIGRS